MPLGDETLSTKGKITQLVGWHLEAVQVTGSNPVLSTKFFELTVLADDGSYRVADILNGFPR